VNDAQSSLTHVDDYTFGRITVAGKTCTSDVIMRPESMRDGWWRKTGHSLCLADLEEILSDPPRRLLVGRGHDDRMKVPPDVVEALTERGIEVRSMPTGEAVALWNRWLDAEGTTLNAVAALHLTC
jgi:hypothetical protein